MKTPPSSVNRAIASAVALGLAFAATATVSADTVSDHMSLVRRIEQTQQQMEGQRPCQGHTSDEVYQAWSREHERTRPMREEAAFASVCGVTLKTSLDQEIAYTWMGVGAQIKERQVQIVERTTVLGAKDSTERTVATQQSTSLCETRRIQISCAKTASGKPNAPVYPHSTSGDIELQNGQSILIKGELIVCR